MNNIKISIIVIIYNAEQTLSKCIESILNQELQQFELILVDDGSTDKSIEICYCYAMKDSRIKVISKKNEGQMLARIAGMKEAKADIIGFVDSDDWIERGMYSEMVQIYERYKCELVSSGIYKDYKKYDYSTEVKDHYAEGLYTNIEGEIYPTMLWDKSKEDFGLYGNVVNKIFKKNILESVSDGLDTRVFYGEDCLMLYAYMMKVSRIYIMNKSFYHYNINQESICSKKNEKLLVNSYYLYENLKGIFSSCKKECRYMLMQQLKNYIMEVECHNLNLFFDINLKMYGEWNYNYPELRGKDVIIYGAGGGSLPLYRYLNEKCHIVAWVDKYPLDKSEKCFHDIISIDSGLKKKYDYIVIGVLNKELAMKIKRQLVDKYKINTDKILWREAKHLSIFGLM